MPVNVSVHEFAIGDNMFYLRRFPAFYALEVFGDLQKQFAGPLSALLDGKETPKDAEGNIILNKDTVSNLSIALKNLSEKLDGKTLRKIAEILIDKECISVAINGAEPRRLDATAQGLTIESVADIITICWEVLKFNYSEVITRLANPTMLARLTTK